VDGQSPQVIMTMKTNLFIKSSVAMMALYCSGFALAGGEGWTSDFTAAKKQATESKKDLLIDFTGSDWCGWCIKLNEEVFSKDAFKAGVKDTLVLVELDYPKDKSKLTAETIQQNKELAEKYPISGYPSIILTDAEGKPYAATGYQEGGPEAYVKHLNELREKKVVRDKSFASAAKSSGVEKAKALVAALEAMGLEDKMISNFYGEVVKEIKAADPKDETGFAKASAAKDRLAAVQSELMACGKKGDHAGALAVMEKAIKEGGFGTDDTQKMMVTRAMILSKMEKFDEAFKALAEAKAAAPDSEMAKSMDSIKERIEGAKKEAAEAAEKKPGA
jgi:thioredoxin-related protein